jgi:hypothetical protein
MIINNQPDSFHSVTSYTVPYTTTSGITCFNRDSIAAVTEVSFHEIEVHLKSGSIFTITEDELTSDIIMADLMGLSEPSSIAVEAKELNRETP